MAVQNPITSTVVDLRPMPRSIKTLEDAIAALQIQQENIRRIVEMLVTLFGQDTTSQRRNPIVQLPDLTEMLALR